MDSEKVIKRDNEYVLHTYGRNPVVLEKGHGLYAEGPEGFPPEFSELGASCSDYSYIPHVHSSGILIVFLYFA